MTEHTSLPPFLIAWDEAARRAAGALPANVLDAARRSWFDTVAVTAAGVHENCTQAALQACAPIAAEALPPADAALALGAASHALDYDDVCMLATCHPSAPVVAAMLALLPVLRQQRPGLSWGELLGAYTLGTETSLRLGAWLGFRHYGLGFHATDTLGVVGVAATVSQLLGLATPQSHAALAIAASNSSGLRANFGTDTKPLHVGFAAAAGLRAALLARAGADASNDVWGPSGFFLAYGGGEAMTPLQWSADTDWALVQPGFEHKRFPSCYLTHRLIAGILALRTRHAHYAGDPMRIDIEVPCNGLTALKYPEPVNGLQGKFSGPYCAAVAWIDGRAELPSFSDAAVQRPALRAQMRDVSLRERSEAGERLDTAPVHVTVRGDGWSDSINVDWAPGSPADPMTREQLQAKWRDCTARSGLPADAAAVTALLDAPLDTPASALLQPLRTLLLSAMSSDAAGRTRGDMKNTTHMTHAA